MTRSVYINAASAVTAAGVGAEVFMRDVYAGRASLCEEHGVLVAALPEDVRAMCDELRKEPHLRSLDQAALLAVLAARDLFKTYTIPSDAGALIGSSRGATQTIEREVQKYFTGQNVSAMASPTSTAGGLASTVASDRGLCGPTFSVSSACATGINTLGVGYAFLKSGIVNDCLSGGTEASITPFTISMLKRAKIYHQKNLGVSFAPFSPRRNGMVLGDASCVLALSVKANGQSAVKVLAYAACNESEGLTGISCDGQALQRASESAFEQAGMSPHDVDAVVAHGAGTAKGDAAEYAAYQAIFRGELPAMVWNKHCVGHTLGAAGALSLLMGKHILNTGVLPVMPYPSLFDSDRPRPSRLKTVMVIGLGFGGNASVILLGTN